MNTYEISFEYEYETVDDPDSEAVFIESRKGKKLLQFNGYRYRKAYRTKYGIRWVCSTKKSCSAFIYLNDEDEVLMKSKLHNHPPPAEQVVSVCHKEDSPDTAVVITSRKGKEMLLFRKFTYRKQYSTAEKDCRWVCSTKKNCNAVVFTDSDNQIRFSQGSHTHDPPKYYSDPVHILHAIREPIVLETE